jgi:hypothetical protein
VKCREHVAAGTLFGLVADSVPAGALFNETIVRGCGNDAAPAFNWLAIADCAFQRVAGRAAGRAIEKK